MIFSQHSNCSTLFTDPCFQTREPGLPWWCSGWESSHFLRETGQTLSLMRTLLGNIFFRANFAMASLPPLSSLSQNCRGEDTWKPVQDAGQVTEGLLVSAAGVS